MKRTILVVGVLLAVANVASATIDTFGTGANQFTIEFVTISGDASSANGTNISGRSTSNFGYKTFTDPGNFRISKFEITNDQWNKFKENVGGIVSGYPSSGYNQTPSWTGSNIPTNQVSWYEAAQFVNYLNTDAGYAPAYKFTGTPGTSSYTFSPWSENDTGYDAVNPYRNKNAFYVIPTEEEWVKAAYWNGTTLQEFSTKNNQAIFQGDGREGTGWNYLDDVFATDPPGPWQVGSGSEELNGTYDMTGNVWEWVESTWYINDYTARAGRVVRGGSYCDGDLGLGAFNRFNDKPYFESYDTGFRVASIPEPCSLVLLGLGGLILRRKKR